VLMGYNNPIERMGLETFAQRAAKAGVDGVLVVDLPPEEADETMQVLRRHGLDLIFLLAPPRGLSGSVRWRNWPVGMCTMSPSRE